MDQPVTQAARATEAIWSYASPPSAFRSVKGSRRGEKKRGEEKRGGKKRTRREGMGGEGKGGRSFWQ